MKLLLDNIKLKNNEGGTLNSKADETDEIDEALEGSRNRKNELEMIYSNISIKIEREQFSIFELNRRNEKGKIKLDPDFQRNSVWNIQRKRELIESVIMGLPLQLIYTSSNAEGELVIIDGKQRLTTFFEFLNNKFRLINLNILSELNGKNFKDLDAKYQSKIEDFQLFLQVIKPPTPDRIQFDIFDRVNRGGIALNNQEMRNALYHGKSTELLMKLSKNENLIKTIGDLSKRMKDRYLILRFLAFYIHFNKHNSNEYNGDIDEFLGLAMTFINKLKDEEIKLLEEKFTDSLQRVFIALGKDCFRIPSSSSKRNPVNMILFETFLFVGIFITDKAKLKTFSHVILENEEFRLTLGRNRDNKNRVYQRFNLIKKLLGEL